MTRIFRSLPCFALACSLTVAGVYGQAAKPAAATAPAADVPATQPEAPAIPQNLSLKEDLENYIYYGRIARYDLAAAYGNKILSRSEPPLEILKTAEDTVNALRVPGQQGGGLDDVMIRFQGLDNKEMREVSTKVAQLMDKGRFEQRNDPKFVIANIERLVTNQRGYANGVANLRNSGEMAVPVMIDWLRDPAKAQYHDAIGRALVDMGRIVLNPLLAATEMKDNNTLLTLMSDLRQLGSDAALPYLGRIANDNSRPAETRSFARQAMGRLNNGQANMAVPDLFFHLAERYYDGKATIAVDPKAANAYMWSWTEQGLNYKTVPPVVFNDLMAMREACHALELGTGRGDAMSLLLAAGTKLEVDLPEGATLSVFPKERPGAHFFNDLAGTQYVNAALNRSLRDHNSAVALKLIKSVAMIVGPSSQGSGASIDPLVQSLHYPDRLVRFEAAFALANGLPVRNFEGHELVAPLLAEAVAQTGSGNVLIVAPSQSDIARLSNDFKGYGIASGTTAQQALSEASSLPWVDAIVIAEDIGNEQIDQIYNITAGNARLERSAKVILAHTKASPWYQRSVNDPLTVVTIATDAEGEMAALAEARTKSGGLSLDEKVATDYATRAANLLQRIAEGRVQVFDLTPVQAQLLAALNDKRPEIVKQIADTVAYIDGPSVQPSLLARAADEKAADEIKIAVLRGLAKNAKFFGNHLNEQQTGDLQHIVESSQNPDVRTAAAEARGALNLPVDQVKSLIIQQSKP